MGNLIAWFRNERDEKEAFDYIIDLTTMYDFGPKAPCNKDDIENLVHGVELIVKSFGYSVKKYVVISTDGCASEKYVKKIEEELKELEKEQCDLLLVKEYDAYVFCLVQSK